MTQTTGPFFDEIAKLMTNAAGAAQGMRKEFDTMMRSQGERMIREFDLVQREDFEAVKLMAEKAREENIRLEERINALEAMIKGGKPLVELPHRLFHGEIVLSALHRPATHFTPATELVRR